VIPDQINDQARDDHATAGVTVATACVPAGQRVYAIGDIHGRLDLLEPLARAIEADDTTAPAAQTTVILLGDLIDRGADSKGVLDFARAWRQRRTVRILMGNHEEMFLDAFTDLEWLARLLPHGAYETLESYGIAVRGLDRDSLRHVQTAMAERIPEEDRRFMAGFEASVVIGDYLFVHAGIEPGIAVDRQSERTLRWIREPFLSHREPYSHVVVHGHTIRPQVEECPNRIGIDTGGYCYDVLTALVLEGGTRRFIQARGTGSAVTIETRAAAV